MAKPLVQTAVVVPVMTNPQLQTAASPVMTKPAMILP
jgi:hypothetical protein